ncbi:MAG: MFS transporter [Actinomycetota bacterium]|nr:MFS transporter [Actinomycetota bacterium]
MTAEWAYFVALGIFAYRSGGTFAVGLVGLIRMLPSALVAPFASFLGDRYSRQRVLVALQLAKTAAVSASAVAFFLDAPDPVIYALAAIVGIALTLYWPIQSAIVPWLGKRPAEVIAANAASSTIESLGILIGPLLGGALVAATDPGVAFSASAGLHLFAALMLARIHVDVERLRSVKLSDKILADAGAGWTAIWRSRGARLIVALFWAQSAVRGALNVLTVVAGLSLLHVGSSGVGFLTAAPGAGGLFGGVVALSLVGRRIGVPFGLGMIAWGLPIALIAAWPNPWLAFLLLAVVGAGNSVLDVAGVTLLQRAVPDEHLARVFGVLYGGAMGAVGVGSIGAAWLTSAFGVRGGLVTTGLFLPLLAFLFWRHLLAVDRNATLPAQELALMRQVPMFAQLSVAATEHLARRLIPVVFPAGANVVRQGEVGDRFYVVASGDADVECDGRALEPLHAGDFFGEIALLRDIPRTATVTARTDVRLYALERDAFLSIATGHVVGRQAAETTVKERLAAAAPTSR